MVKKHFDEVFSYVINAFGIADENSKNIHGIPRSGWYHTPKIAAKCFQILF
jgi:hypothetical protein